MKIRTDFVTNSSSSSFIVVFKDKREMEQSYKYMCNEIGEDFADIFYKDFCEHLRDRKAVETELYKMFVDEGYEKLIYIRTSIINLVIVSIIRSMVRIIYGNG